MALDWSVRYEELSSKQPSYSLIFGVVFRIPYSPHGPQPSSAIYAVYYHVQLIWYAARTQGSVHTGQALCQLGCIPSPSALGPWVSPDPPPGVLGLRGGWGAKRGGLFAHRFGLILHTPCPSLGTQSCLAGNMSLASLQEK